MSRFILLTSFVVMLQGDIPVMAEGKPIDIKVHMLEKLEELTTDNQSILNALNNLSTEKAIFTRNNSIYIEAKVSEGHPGYRFVYDYKNCRFNLPPTRSAEIEITAGQVSSIQMFSPLNIITLKNSILMADLFGQELSRSGCLQFIGPSANITEERIEKKVGEKSSILGGWKLCDLSNSQIIATVRYFGQQYVGSSVPLGVFENPFHEGKDRFLLELDITLQSPFDERLRATGYDLNKRITGQRFTPPPLVGWIENPQWYDPER